MNGLCATSALSLFVEILLRATGELLGTRRSCGELEGVVKALFDTVGTVLDLPAESRQ